MTDLQTRLRNDRRAVPIIVILSIAIPVVVATLLALPGAGDVGLDLGIFPKLNAVLNATVSVLLVWGFLVIKQYQRTRNAGLIQRHMRIQLGAFGLSALFLVSYVIYHALSADQATFGGEGWIRPVYFTILITHIVLAALILPLILFTLYRGLSGEYDRHRKLARWTFPLWLYVSVTGVAVYVMMAPYYGH